MFAKVRGGGLTSIPTLPPRRNTLPGRLSPRLFDTCAFNLTNPSRPPPNRSTDWTSIWRRIYGSWWNSCDGFCCRARERCTVEIHVLNAGNVRRSLRLRSGVLLTLVSESGSVNVDMAACLGLSGARWGEHVRFRCRAVRRSLGSMGCWNECWTEGKRCE